MHARKGNWHGKNWDIVILCSPLVIDWIRKTFAEQIDDQQLPASIIWSGPSSRYGQGVVVIEWEGEPSEHFIRQLKIDTEVIDYMLYEVPTVEGYLPERPAKDEYELQQVYTKEA